MTQVLVDLLFQVLFLFHQESNFILIFCKTFSWKTKFSLKFSSLRIFHHFHPHHHLRLSLEMPVHVKIFCFRLRKKKTCFFLRSSIWRMLEKSFQFMALVDKEDKTKVCKKVVTKHYSSRFFFSCKPH